MSDDLTRTQKHPEPTGLEKSLLFLLSLDEGVATRILKRLSPEEVRKLRTASETVKDVPPEVVAGVYMDFARKMERGAPANMRGSAAYLRRLVGQAMGEGKATDLWSESEAREGVVAQLASLDVSTIMALLEREHPQTLAVVLSQMESARAAEVVQRFPEEMQVQIMLRMSKLEKVPTEVIERIEAQFSTELESLSSGERVAVDGLKMAAGLLKRLDDEMSERILDEMNSTDENVVEKLRKSLFTFEDLVRINGRGMQALLKEVSTNQLVLALKTASEELLEKVLASVSSRAGAMIREELELLGPTQLSEVEEAQQAVVEVALTLERDGKIQIAREGGEGYV